MDYFVSSLELDVQRDFMKKVNNITVGKKFYVHSFGCQQNVADGEKIKGQLSLMGYEETNEIKDADIIFFNTCAVRENAEARVFGNVGELKHLKKNNPELIIGLCGCMTQQEHISQKIKKSYPYVDIAIGTHLLHKIPEFVFGILSNRKRIFSCEDSFGVIAEGLPIKREGNLKAWIPIMYGCNNFCSYCIVPYVRGRERSRKSEDILLEVREVIAQGFKEITLLGQNVNSYGKGIENEIDFATLLRRINDIPGDFRVRFMTSHPKDATKELIDAICDCDKVCKHLHLPVQCGNDRVLKEMNRHYNVKKYLDIVEYAKEKIPDISLTSDIIVGFPSETHDEFLNTVELIKKVKYDLLYTFVYSKREGTVAAKMGDPVSTKEKGLWLRELLAVQEEITLERMNLLVGKTLRVLVDSHGKTPGYLSGRSDTNIIVEFIGDPSLIGEFVDVKITTPCNWAVIGEKI